MEPNGRTEMTGSTGQSEDGGKIDQSENTEKTSQSGMIGTSGKVEKSGLERPVRSVDYSRTEQVHILFSRDLNHQGKLYGGQLMAWIDEIAAVVAMRLCGGNIVTASVDHLDFKSGARLGETLYMQAFLTYVGRTSMEVRVDSYVENMEDGSRHLINRAYLVTVAIDQDGRPVPVPGLKLENIGQQAEWEAGKKRQALRKRRVTEGF